MVNSKYRQKEKVLDLDLQVQSLSSDEKLELVNETKLAPQYVQVEETYESGTIKITEELEKKVIEAIKSRVDATKDYTERRVKDVNDAYAMKEQKDLSTEADNQMYYSVVKDTIEDWVDDLYLMFSKLTNSIEVEAKDLSFEEYIIKSLSYPGEDKNAIMLADMLKQINGQDTAPMRGFAFDRLECIKSFMVKTIEYSGYIEEIEEYLTHGVISGLFCSKETFGDKQKQSVILRKETEGSTDGIEYIGQGNIISILKDTDAFIFKAVDTRNLIFPKENFGWVIETIDTTFHKLLEMCVGVDGKPIANSPYDYKQLRKIKEYIKLNNPKDIIKDAEDDEIDEDLYGIDGDIKIQEAHNIPLLIKGRVTKCVATTVMVGDKSVAIGVRPTWFFNGHPYRFTPFIKKDKDVGGIGLPMMLKGLQEKLNDIFNFSNDILEFSIYGITIGEKDKLANPNACAKLKPKSFIQVKNLEGQSIKEVFDWIRPPVDLIGPAQNMMMMISDMVSRSSRKGIGGEKITPSPTATEFDSMAKELGKTVNRVAINLNIAMKDMIYTAYAYTLLNRTSHTKLKLNGYLVSDSSLKEISKLIELTPEELYLKDVNFKINVMDYDVNKLAVERQQSMQAIDLIYKVGVTEQSTDPTTGQPITQPKVYLDDVGNELVIDEYKLISDTMQKMGFDPTDIFKRKKAEEPVVKPTQTPTPEGMPGGQQAPGVPPTSKSPMTADVMKSAVQLNNG